MNLQKFDMEVLDHPDGIVYPDGTKHVFTPEEKLKETAKIKEATKHTRLKD
jgi:hypothetical protein